MRVAGALVAIAGVPLIALILLVLVGSASAGPALLASAVILLAALALALFWSRDLHVLAETLRQVGDDEPAVRSVGEPFLPGMQRLGRAAERLARRVTARAALVERLRRADGIVVERLPDPLIVLAADRSVRRANSAAHAAFGADMPAVLRHPDLQGAIDRAFASGVTETADVTLPAPVPREVHAAVVPVDPPMADGSQAVVVLSDRTRERAVERTRADFVANVSHELRTPLASLIGFIDTLRGPAADDPASWASRRRG
jgi:two-component system phosphate regulon sensor histidine kinase PhoR